MVGIPTHSQSIPILCYARFTPLRSIGGAMKILNSTKSVASGKKDKCAYKCWMCGKGHNNSIAFLWHISACELETTGKSELLVREKMVLSNTNAIAGI